MVSRYDFTLKKKREVVRIRENASMLRDDLKKLIKESTQEEEKSVEILLLYLQIVKDLQI